MDTESACAMWEEANCPYKAQLVILRHLIFSWVTHHSPWKFIRELEDGSGQKDIDGKAVCFWHKNIDEVIAHRLKLEMMHDHTFATKYDHIDVAFGGDHGVRLLDYRI